LLQQLSELTEAHVGGTTGALYGLFFAAASHLFRDESDDDQVTWKHWLAAGRLGLAAIVKYGLAELGDRCMVPFSLTSQYRVP